MTKSNKNLLYIYKYLLPTLHIQLMLW